jgi:AsmA protein
MRLSGKWAWAGLAAALAVGCASVPWNLDPAWLSARMNDAAPISGFHWDEPSRATLRLLPAPVLNVDGLKLVDGAKKVAFEASTAAFGLSATDLVLGRYVFLRARVKDPTAEIDLDAFAVALPELMKSPPLRTAQMRGGRLRLVSRRLGVNEELSPVAGDFSWLGENQAFRLKFSGVWRGQGADVDFSLTSPADFLAGLPSEASLNVSTEGAAANLKGTAQLGDKPGFTGAAKANAQSLSGAAHWLGLDDSPLADHEAEVSGKVSLSPQMVSLDEGTLGFKRQSFEGTASLSKGAGGWSASATLAAEQLDLAKLIGPPPEIFTPHGEWSPAAAAVRVPDIDLDFRLSAADLTWGAASFVDAALVLQRQADKSTLKIIEAGYAGGGLNGEIEISDCAILCQTRASLTLANADLATLMHPFGRKSLSGRVTGEFDFTGAGESPASLVETAHGQLRIDAVDGEIRGVNFEEALRRSQRRSLDLARDLAVGKTMFSKVSAELTIADGAAVFESARLIAPGLCIAGAGRVELAERAWAAAIDARQADSQGDPSAEGASLSLGLNGSWRSPKLSLNPRSD